MRQFTRNFYVIFITCVHFRDFCTFEDEKSPLLNIFLFKTAEKAVFLMPSSPLIILITVTGQVPVVCNRNEPGKRKSPSLTDIV